MRRTARAATHRANAVRSTRPRTAAGREAGAAGALPGEEHGRRDDGIADVQPDGEKHAAVAREQGWLDSAASIVGRDRRRRQSFGCRLSLVGRRAHPRKRPRLSRSTTLGCEADKPPQMVCTNVQRQQGQSSPISPATLWTLNEQEQPFNPTTSDHSRCCWNTSRDHVKESPDADKRCCGKVVSNSKDPRFLTRLPPAHQDKVRLATLQLHREFAFLERGQKTMAAKNDPNAG
jgi:hypothetical protein